MLMRTNRLLKSNFLLNENSLKCNVGGGGGNKGSKCSSVIIFLIITIKYLVLPPQHKKKINYHRGLFQSKTFYH